MVVCEKRSATTPSSSSVGVTTATVIRWSRSTSTNWPPASTRSPTRLWLRRHCPVRHAQRRALLVARKLIRERTGKPVTRSHVLSASLGGLKRGVTALLNARLIAMIDDLVATTGGSLAERGIDAPMMIVRGNGSLVSVDFVKERPVETILSSAAASSVRPISPTPKMP